MLGVAVGILPLSSDSECFNPNLFQYESGKNGPISIDSGDEEGKSVTLRNDSNEDVHIGGWQVRRLLRLSSDNQ